MNALETFASTIKENLLAAGFSYKKFGEALGSIPHQTVSRWVNGQGLPEFERLYPIATALNIDYASLHALWIDAISERGRRIAGEPLDAKPSELHEDLPTTITEIRDMKLRMERLEQEIKRLNRKSE
ncbi:MAG: helix-turn-helix transcriptional regulator [Acidimicrobiaceae bacterium]|nr:helix-turn-helix transcriptional regulator [Acidimicrobiaceae bacterium]